MSDELKRTIVSEPGAAVLHVEIELPDYLKRAISDSLEQGKRAAQRESALPKVRIPAKVG